MSTFTSKLEALLNESDLPENDKQNFLAIWEPFEAKRKEMITRTGEVDRYLYFVNEGVQRVYYVDEQGREATIVFTYSPSFGGVIDSFMMQTPSKYCYETLTPSSFIRTTHTQLFQLMEKSIAVNMMIRDALTQAVAGVLERLVEVQCFSSEEKFRQFMHRSPHMLQLVPHKYLANYMGIDPTNFSKLVNRIKI